MGQSVCRALTADSTATCNIQVVRKDSVRSFARARLRRSLRRLERRPASFWPPLSYCAPQAPCRRRADAALWSTPIDKGACLFRRSRVPRPRNPRSPSGGLRGCRDRQSVPWSTRTEAAPGATSSPLAATAKARRSWLGIISAWTKPEAPACSASRASGKSSWGPKTTTGGASGLRSR